MLYLYLYLDCIIYEKRFDVNKRIKQSLTVATLGIAFIVAFLTRIPAWGKIAFFIVPLVMVTINSKGSRLMAKANQIIQKRDNSLIPDAIKLYSEALKAGVPDNFQMVAATMLIQHGDPEEGRKYLEPLLNHPKKEVRCPAKISLSMYYWIKKDLGKAISLCEEVRDENYRNRNLYTNLCTYYIDRGNTKEFEKLLKEAVTTGNVGVPIYDLEAVSSMLRNDYKRAGEILTSLFAQAEPSFADPYIHMAVIKLHYGNVRDAIELLRKAERTVFSNTVLYALDEIVKIKEGLENPDTRLQYVHSLENNLSDIINGRRIKLVENKYPVCNDDMLEGCPEEPSFKEDNNLNHFLSENIHEKDERELNTDITDDDEEWIRKHSDN